MNHLNLFHPFEGRELHHEDVLTRNFLLLLKNIPLVQVGFFEMIRDYLSSKGIPLESIAKGDLKLSEIYTQVDSNDKLFNNLSDVTMLSIVISDDAFEANHTVVHSDRHARYDGVVFCSPSWVFIIENKPSVVNIWEDQLNPNISGSPDIHLIKEPCALSWRDILSFLNALLSGNLLTPLESSMVNDFIEYVDENYSWLNPYQSFVLCKSNKYLLDRRCCAILKSYRNDLVVKYRKGWKHYIDIGDSCVQNIALDSSFDDTGCWSINLWMYTGNVMRSARATYAQLNVDRLLELAKNDPHLQISSDLHFSFRSSNLFWPTCSVDIQTYLQYWKGQNLRQIKRDEFESYFRTLIKDGIVDPDDYDRFYEQIISKSYPTLNICPGFLIKYTWNQREAIALDNNKTFDATFRNTVNTILDSLG